MFCSTVMLLKVQGVTPLFPILSLGLEENRICIHIKSSIFTDIYIQVNRHIIE